jgi:Na+/H+-dicarboxylate symporter
LLPAWAVAFASRSSLATLPTLIDALERRLGLPPAAPRFVLPVGASVFRPASGWMLPLGAWTLARLYGVPLGPSDALTLAILSALLSFGVPSIPGGSVLVAAPLLLAVGVPVDGLGLLLGVDALVDPFRTVANVHEHDPQAVGQRQMQELERHGRE